MSNRQNTEQGIVAAAATALDGTSQQQCPTDGAGDLSYAEKLRARLDYLEDWYFHPQKFDTKISQWEVSELKKFRPHLWAQDEDGPKANVQSPMSGDGGVEHSSTAIMGQRGSAALPVQGDHCDTYREIAARLALHYRGKDGASTLKYEISPKVVSDWKLNKRLPVNVPMPPARVPNSRFFSLREWIAWFDEFLWPEWKLDSAPLSAGDMVPLHALEEREKREKIEFAQWERQRELGRYIDVVTAGRMAGGEMRQLGEYWRRRNEVDLVVASQKKLIELGVATEVAGMHTDWLRGEHQRMTDAIEDKIAEQAGKYQEALKQEIERQNG